jgi:hypothetical protein
VFSFASLCCAGFGFEFVDIPKIKTKIVDFNKCTDMLVNNHNNDASGITEDTTWQYGDIHNLPPDNATWVQQYIVNPLLSKNKYKNSIRSYMLILSVKPPLVLFHEGMVYRSLENYMDWSNDTTWANGNGASKFSRETQLFLHATRQVEYSCLIQSSIFYVSSFHILH